MESNERFVRLSDLQKAFKDMPDADEVIASIPTLNYDKILQEVEIAEFSTKVQEIMDHFNKVAGTQYKPNVQKTRELIRARMKEGFTVEDFKTVINKKSRWLSDKNMKTYFRPITLFSNKFEGYLNEAESYKFSGNKQESSFERIQRLAREGRFREDEESDE